MPFLSFTAHIMNRVPSIFKAASLLSLYSTLLSPAKMPSSAAVLLFSLLYSAAAALAAPLHPTAFSTVTARATATVRLPGGKLTGGPTAFSAVSRQHSAAINPFSSKAALIRYWSRKIPNNRPKPTFLLSRASPLSASQAALFERLAANPGDLAAHLSSFCSSAALFCLPDLAATHDHGGAPAAFSSYISKDFSNYATDKAGGATSFKTYSPDQNIPTDSFRSYGRRSSGHSESFSNYAPNGNLVTGNFTSYGGSATGGTSDFTAYDRGSNVPNLKFTNYDTEATGRTRRFKSYSDDTNSGGQSFSGYGKRGTGIPLSFTSYGNNSNVIGSDFKNYGEDATSARDNFTSYGFNGNVPENKFSSYGSGGHGGIEKFSSYRREANVGDNSFSSYGKGATGGAAASFTEYGQSFNIGDDTFTGYGEKSVGKIPIDFTTYGRNTTFKDYADKKSVSFNAYNATIMLESKMNRWIEPGRFFRESVLKEGTEIQLPDLRDKMPVRAFLPRSVASKLPFSSGKLEEMNRAFNTTGDSVLGKAMASTVAECERAPSRGERKLCARSVEDMIDFAVEVLGNDAVVRSTESADGSLKKAVIGEVRSIDGGKETKAVSCHQSLFPYQVYYCHAVPRVRVYEAAIDGEDGGGRINGGVAICHLDTSDWSAGHGAFVALGGGPGRIEVCHWIYPGDMTWTVSD